MKRTPWLALPLGGIVMAGWLAGSGTASATMEMQKQAKAAGIAGATSCSFCHNEKLPKKGAVTHNERGQWLIAEKEKRKAKAVDAAWLKDYVEKK
jgi:hypothetical protein